MVTSSSSDRVPRLRALALRAVAGAALLVTPVVTTVAAPSSARADSASLAEARRALDEVRYDKAQELLGTALRDGGNSPETMVEIYALAASTAIVLGKEELGELYYRRLLSLDPDADLEAGLAPKFKRAFTAAQAYVSAQGALRVRTRRLPEGVAVSVESDPLAMVAAVSLRSAKGPSRLDPERRAVLPLAADAHGDDERVLLLDEHGNRLRALPVPELEGAAAPPASAGAPVRAEGADAPSALRTWWIWTIPSAVALGVGIGFGVQSRAEADELDELLAGPSPYYDEAEALRSRSHRYATIANVSFVAAGAFAVVAGVMLATRPEAKPTATATGPSLVPAFGRDGSVGLVLTGTL